MKNYYEILEIDNNANKVEIKKAYRRLAIKYHPDKNFGDKLFTQKFIKVKKAYDILIDTQKRLEFDKEYKEYINKQSSAQKQEEREQREKLRKEEKEREERFYYEPFKPFYSERDRDLQDTPQVKPIFDLWDKKLSEHLKFFILPKRIGKIIGAYSDFIPGVKFYKKYRFIPGVKFYKKFHRKNLFFGVNGFAVYECEDNIENITKKIEVNFNDITDLYVYQIEEILNFRYIGTKCFYMYFNANNGNVAYTKVGDFDKKLDIRFQDVELNLCRKTEQYWTIYLLDKMEEKLQKYGFILFNIYLIKKHTYIPYIKLEIGQITFIKRKNKEFTYKFNEIKRMYLKGNEIHIQHLNFKKSTFLFKSGNEDIIPILNLCNRQFFFKAIELLLGYKI